MKKTALIFWPESGNVDNVANKIVERFNSDEIVKVSVRDVNDKILSECDNWIIGGSTVGSHVWEDADDSNKWHTFFKHLDEIDLSKKTVAFYGLGDQILYPHHFVDGLGVLQEEFEKRNAKITGQWPTDGYKFFESDGQKDGKFFGLALDEDNQDELTDERIDKWLSIIKKDFK